MSGRGAPVPPSPAPTTATTTTATRPRTPSSSRSRSSPSTQQVAQRDGWRDDGVKLSVVGARARGGMEKDEQRELAPKGSTASHTKRENEDEST